MVTEALENKEIVTETLENKETATEAEPEMEEHPVEGMFCYFVGCLVNVC